MLFAQFLTMLAARISLFVIDVFFQIPGVILGALRELSAYLAVVHLCH
jgi:hypothetical protein